LPVPWWPDFSTRWGGMKPARVRIDHVRCRRDPAACRLSPSEAKIDLSGRHPPFRDLLTTRF
jgi:hypothetical protein